MLKSYLPMMKVRYTGGKNEWMNYMRVLLLANKKMPGLRWKPKRTCEETVRTATRFARSDPQPEAEAQVNRSFRTTFEEGPWAVSFEISSGSSSFVHPRQSSEGSQ